MTLPKTSVKSRLVGLYHKYKHLLILLYFVVYMAWFSYVEKNIKTHFHVVHVPLDDYIPFCEYFVIPYLLWFGYVAWGIAYMALHNKSDYYRLPQWTVQSATVDRTVCYSGLYSPLP